MYHFLRRTLDIPFYTGEAALDTSLRKIFAAIQQHDMDDVIIGIFKRASEEGTLGFTVEADDHQRLAMQL